MPPLGLSNSRIHPNHVVSIGVMERYPPGPQNTPFKGWSG